MTSTQKPLRQRSTTEQRLDLAIGVILLVSAGAAVGGMFGLLLVWGGRVMPAWAVGATLLLVSLLLTVARSIIRKQRNRATGEGSPRRRSGWWTALAVVTAICAGFIGFRDLAFDASYQVLQPSGPGFCQAVAREDSFLFSGGGELYKVGFGGIGMPVSSWTADDGYRPIESGSYDFKWTSDGALLSVYGSGVDPVWPELHDFDCR
ncbi:hypothetical protein [Arthrobacter sp. GMC3]|uniref:hypothetical protein n=1 Tax=Arthrobacter sp. GMC3 TaxID=2058894 RepID=UPI000CE2FEED|nr:hypothetical protein [Arthrobacter sp. GMC3]